MGGGSLLVVDDGDEVDGVDGGVEKASSSSSLSSDGSAVVVVVVVDLGRGRLTPVRTRTKVFLSVTGMTSLCLVLFLSSLVEDVLVLPVDLSVVVLVVLVVVDVSSGGNTKLETVL